MDREIKCEYCGRPIKNKMVDKVIRGKKHTYCSEFCFRLHFYDVPIISYSDLQDMYSVRCISINAPDFCDLIVEED